MLYNFVRLTVTKEIKRFNHADCIIISQNIMDYAIAVMIADKGVRWIVNCVDLIYTTDSLTLLEKWGVNTVYLPECHFSSFAPSGEIDVSNSGASYEEIFFKASLPETIGLDSIMNEFADNTLEYAHKECFLINEVFISGVYMIPSETTVLISRGFFTRVDLEYTKYLVKKLKPTVICVDGAADIALKNGITPDIILGDMDSINPETLEHTGSVVIHSYLDGRCPGEDNVPINTRKGYIACFGTSEDAAILYCIRNKVKKIYTLGYRNTSMEYMEKGRKGMGSSLLIRIFYGHMINDIRNLEKGFWINTEVIYSLGGIFMVLISIGLIFRMVLEVWK